MGGDSTLAFVMYDSSSQSISSVCNPVDEDPASFTTTHNCTLLSVSSIRDSVGESFTLSTMQHNCSLLLVPTSRDSVGGGGGRLEVGGEPI